MQLLGCIKCISRIQQPSVTRNYYLQHCSSAGWFRDLSLCVLFPRLHPLLDLAQHLRFGHITSDWRSYTVFGSKATKADIETREQECLENVAPCLLSSAVPRGLDSFGISITSWRAKGQVLLRLFLCRHILSGFTRWAWSLHCFTSLSWNLDSSRLSKLPSPQSAIEFSFLTEVWELKIKWVAFHHAFGLLQSLLYFSSLSSEANILPVLPVRFW